MSQPAPTPSRRFDRPSPWSALAVVIGLLALAVSLYTAHLLHRQAQASLWPRLELQSSARSEHLLAVNKGSGPALVEQVQVRVDGRTVRNWAELLRDLAIAPVRIDEDYRAAALTGRVLAPGDSHVFYQSLQPGQFEILSAAFDDGRATLRVCYCSSLGDCWWAGHSAPPRPARACNGDSDRFQE